MANSFKPEMLCAICNKPVDLKTTKTNDLGKAVHEECCAFRQPLSDSH
jgi:hypothetical protein